MRRSPAALTSRLANYCSRRDAASAHLPFAGMPISFLLGPSYSSGRSTSIRCYHGMCWRCVGMEVSITDVSRCYLRGAMAR